MLRRILVPLHSSVFAEAVIPTATATADKTGGELRLVHVLEVPPVSGSAG